MSTFIFDEYTQDFTSKELVFNYILDHNNEKIYFTERVTLPNREMNSLPESTKQHLLQALHLILGLSYWKLYCPKEIVIKNYALNEKQAEFWNIVYTKGLGEFFYKNSIDFRNLVQFPFVADKEVSLEKISIADKYLVGIGGGKDSIVSAELMKKNDIPFDGFVVETSKKYKVVDSVIEKLGIDSLNISRIIDPQLMSLNKRYDAYNGHIPISAVYAFLGIFVAALYGYKGLVVSNEKSANIGNVQYLDTEVNHQWSKSYEFERMVSDYLKMNISPDILYISLLRPFSEYKIVELFSLYPQYFSFFSSCNRNFNIQKDQNDQLWCGVCPKCAFVFTLLAVFIEKDSLIEMFGQNLFDQESLLDVYRELLGIDGFKPFECVGTPDEMKLALYNIHEKGQFEDTKVMKIFIENILPSLEIEKIRSEVLKVEQINLPSPFATIV